MYIGIDSGLIDLSLCCIICSQIKKDKGFGCQTRTTDILSLERAAVRSVFPAATAPWLENRPNEQKIELLTALSEQRMAVRTHEQSRGRGTL